MPVDDGLRLHYRTYGEGGETLVLLHGGPGANFMGVGPDLLPLAEDHTLVMYDQRGGRAPIPIPTRHAAPPRRTCATSRRSAGTSGSSA